MRVAGAIGSGAPLAGATRDRFLEVRRASVTTSTPAQQPRPGPPTETHFHPLPRLFAKPASVACVAVPLTSAGALRRSKEAAAVVWVWHDEDDDDATRTAVAPAAVLGRVPDRTQHDGAWNSRDDGSPAKDAGLGEGKVTTTSKSRDRAHTVGVITLRTHGWMVEPCSAKPPERLGHRQDSPVEDGQ